MYQPITQRSYLTEIKLQIAPAANQRIFFLDVPELAGNYIVGISCFDQTYISVSPNGFVVVGTVAGMILTLSEASTESVFQYPCTDLQPGLNGGFIRMFNRKKIDISKCYITILDATGIAINQSVCFNFHYEKAR